jgi:hypothetical protein
VNQKRDILMITTEAMKKRKRSVHYVNNKEFLAALVNYREKVRIAKENDEPIPKVPNYIGECFLKIATHLSFKPNFVNYSYKEDMISDSIENCLHRSTIIPTIEYGPVEIQTLLGKEVTVRCKDGKWRTAVCKSYGEQMLYEYGFSSEHQKVIATKNHRWFVKGNDEAVTDLKIGDCLQTAPLEEMASMEGIILGSTEPLEDRLDLPTTTDPKFIAGFIHGRWRIYSDYKNLYILTYDKNEVNWLKDYSPYVGYHFVDHQMWKMDDKITLHRVTLATPKTHEPQVASIKEYGVDEVFCLEEKETNSFVLGNGLLTGNCVQYILNFDPNKSQNPFAYFTSVIRYAFIRRILKEKKQTEIKEKILEQSGFDEVFFDDCSDNTNSSDYNSIKDSIHSRGRY